ncbi:MAG: GNAT family N-acetyltransferase [Actinobacteria bacterium]|nr:GNAT family N-acetyltransferase [Actinomycetota bacterium]
MSNTKLEVVELQTSETYDLRTAVLRDNTPTSDPKYAEDSKPGTVHLGIFDAHKNLIGTSTWVINPWQEDSTAQAIQLRGMAVAKNRQGTGLGAMLLTAGVIHTEKLKAKYVWAKARDSALNFYLRHDFLVIGEGFNEGITQMPHHLVVRNIDF